VPQEKCIDIALAVEMMHFATVPGAYDLAVLLSGDKDFMPAMVHAPPMAHARWRMAIRAIRAGAIRARRHPPWPCCARACCTGMLGGMLGGHALGAHPAEGVSAWHTSMHVDARLCTQARIRQKGKRVALCSMRNWCVRQIALVALLALTTLILAWPAHVTSSRDPELIAPRPVAAAARATSSTRQRT